MPRRLIRNMPFIIVMEDRTDGTEWYLTHRTSDERFAISDDVPNRWLRGQVRRFGPLEGPYLGRPPRIRLFVRNGRVGYEQVNPPIQGVRDQDNALVMTRRGSTRYTLEWYEGPFELDGDRLGWRLIPE